MKREISKQSKQELIAAIRGRYSKAAKWEKATILDEFVAMTGYHRKHAIRVLGSVINAPRPRPPAASVSTTKPSRKR